MSNSHSVSNYLLPFHDLFSAIPAEAPRFSVVHEARGNRRYMPGLFSEQTPLGFPCHVVSPDQPLGSSSSSFASVASEMILSEFGAARVNNTTLLMVFPICRWQVVVEVGGCWWFGYIVFILLFTLRSSYRQFWVRHR